MAMTTRRVKRSALLPRPVRNRCCEENVEITHAPSASGGFAGRTKVATVVDSRTTPAQSATVTVATPLSGVAECGCTNAVGV